MCASPPKHPSFCYLVQPTLHKKHTFPTPGMHVVTFHWMLSSSSCAHSVPCGMQRREWFRIENKECIYPHLQVGDGPAMQARIAAMESHRATVQQKLLSAPITIQLEDETVEDDPDDRLLLLDDEPEPEIQDQRFQVVEIPEATMPREPEVLVTEPDSIITIPLEPEQFVDTDRIAMPPPPPVPPAIPIDIATPPPPVQLTIPIDIASTLGDTATVGEPPPISVAETEPQPSMPLPQPQVPPTPSPSVPEDTEREALLRQLDLLRLKFKQSVIPPDIETQATPAVRLIVERNLVNLKRARNIAMYKLDSGIRFRWCIGALSLIGCIPGGGGISFGAPHPSGYESVFGMALQQPHIV